MKFPVAKKIVVWSFCLNVGIAKLLTGVAFLSSKKITVGQITRCHCIEHWLLILFHYFRAVLRTQTQICWVVDPAWTDFTHPRWMHWLDLGILAGLLSMFTSRTQKDSSSSQEKSKTNSMRNTKGTLRTTLRFDGKDPLTSCKLCAAWVQAMLLPFGFRKITPSSLADSCSQQRFVRFGMDTLLYSHEKPRAQVFPFPTLWSSRHCEALLTSSLCRGCESHVWAGGACAHIIHTAQRW